MLLWLLRSRESVAGGAQDITAVGIPSAEAFGTPAVSNAPAIPAPAPGVTTGGGGRPVPVFRPDRQRVYAAGIPSAEAFGRALASPVTATVRPAGIGSAPTFGRPTLRPVPVTVAARGVASGEAFGAPAVKTRMALDVRKFGEIKLTVWDDLSTTVSVPKGYRAAVTVTKGRPRAVATLRAADVTKSLPVTPKGAGEMLPSLWGSLEFNDADVSRALAEFDRQMPEDLRGLLDAKVAGKAEG